MNKENKEATAQNSRNSMSLDRRRLAKLKAINADLLAALYSIATEPSAIYSGANARIGDIARAAIAKATATK